MVNSCGQLNNSVPMQAKHRMCAFEGGGQRVCIPPGRSQVVICFLRNTVIDNLEKK